MFEFDERKLLRETADLAQANHRILKKLLWAQRMSQLSSILRWLVILGLALGTYYYLQPFLEQATKVFQVFDLDLNIPDLRGVIPSFEGLNNVL